MNFKRCKSALASLFALSALIAMSAYSAASPAAQELQWQTIIGIKQSGDVVGVGVGKIMGGAPWETLSGSADVNLSTGSVQFDVQGLILAIGALFESGGTDCSPLAGPGFRLGLRPGLRP
jgi:hypothetical protein